MTKIGEIIKDYLNSWTECGYCGDMCTVEHMSSDCLDNPVCKDCVEEEYMADKYDFLEDDYMTI